MKELIEYKSEFYFFHLVHVFEGLLSAFIKLLDICSYCVD